MRGLSVGIALLAGLTPVLAACATDPRQSLLNYSRQASSPEAHAKRAELEFLCNVMTGAAYRTTGCKHR